MDPNSVKLNWCSWMDQFHPAVNKQFDSIAKTFSHIVVLDDEPAHPIMQPIRKLFVGNIDKRATPSQLFNVFRGFGDIVNVFISRRAKATNKAVTFGFVTFRKVEEAKTVMGLRGIRFFSRWLKICPADTWHQPIERSDGTVDFSTTILQESRKASMKQKNDEERCNAMSSSCDKHDDSLDEVDANAIDTSEINKLNDDCLWHIFSYLPIDVQVKASKVCQRWQMLVREMLGKKEKLNFKELNFSTKSIKANDLQPVLEFFGPNIKEIVCNADEDGLATKIFIFLISRYCMNLEKLDISEVVISPRTLLLLSKQCQNLKDIRISGCPELTDFELAYLFNSETSKLETLHIDNLTNLIGNCFSIIKAPLKYLSIKMCTKLSLQFLVENIEQVKGTLKTLIIEDCMNANGVDLSMISRNVPKLTQLTLCDVFYYASLPTYGFNRFTEMQVLDLTSNEAVDDGVIKDIVEGCHQLKKFKLCGPMRRNTLTKQGVMLISKMTWLDELDLSYLEQVDDEVLKAFSKHTTPSQITTFKCEHCDGVGDTGIVSILAACKDLELLGVVLCSSITNETVINAVNFLNKRHSNKMLTLMAFGTGISISEKPKLSHPLLKVNLEASATLGLVDEFLVRCGRDIFYDDLGLSDYEDDDDDDDEDIFFDDDEDFDEDEYAFFDQETDDWFNYICRI